MKLHLGCGLQYIEGYVNIDYPNDGHLPNLVIRADKYADILDLVYPEETVEEIRLHHVLEHFSRPVALALICRWRDWLQTGGLLRLETPDILESSRLLISPSVSYDHKQQVLRHLFGSHQAPWAVHQDGWYKDKFETSLKALGFERLRFEQNQWGSLRNIEVFARKSHKRLGLDEYRSITRGLLTLSTIRVGTKDPAVPEAFELTLLELWMDIWERTYKEQMRHS
jgi:predicted SAM-dependent methyltransferase